MLISRSITTLNELRFTARQGREKDWRASWQRPWRCKMLSMKRERKIRFFQPDAYISLDYDAKRAQIYRKTGPGKGLESILAETVEMQDGDALADEIDSFLESVVLVSLSRQTCTMR